MHVGWLTCPRTIGPIVTRSSVAFIKKAAAAGDPFFVFVGATGPHLPAEPAPWHEAIADNLTISAPRTPNFNQLGVDHFDLLATHPILSDAVVADIDHLMRQRCGVLLSIDDLVAGLHQAVKDAGLLDSTYFLFSSDHGYHLGQFRIPIEKMLPYETDIRIPLFIMGPGIAPGTKIHEMVANIDVSPTLLDLAGIPVPPIMDGMSMKPLLMGALPVPAGWRTRFASEFAEGGYQVYGPFPLCEPPLPPTRSAVHGAASNLCRAWCPCPRSACRFGQGALAAHASAACC